VTKGVPYLFFFALAMIWTAIFMPSNLPSSLTSGQMTLLWLGCAALTGAYMIAHSIDYVSWPRLVPLVVKVMRVVDMVGLE